MVFSPEEISARLRERPFQPLRILLTTGESYDVHHPDLVLVGRRSLIIGTPSSVNAAHFDHVTRVALVHVVELRDLPLLVSPPGNGTSS